jgi:hypothetical protein
MVRARAGGVPPSVTFRRLFHLYERNFVGRLDGFDRLAEPE